LLLIASQNRRLVNIVPPFRSTVVLSQASGAAPLYRYHCNAMSLLVFNLHYSTLARLSQTTVLMTAIKLVVLIHIVAPLPPRYDIVVMPLLCQLYHRLQPPGLIVLPGLPVGGLHFICIIVVPCAAVLLLCLCTVDAVLQLLLLVVDYFSSRY
jgi:hypothetical protein